jgi:hypothetical protein
MNRDIIKYGLKFNETQNEQLTVMTLASSSITEHVKNSDFDLHVGDTRFESP